MNSRAGCGVCAVGQMARGSDAAAGFVVGVKRTQTRPSGISLGGVGVSRVRWQNREGRGALTVAANDPPQGGDPLGSASASRAKSARSGVASRSCAGRSLGSRSLATPVRNSLRPSALRTSSRSGTGVARTFARHPLACDIFPSLYVRNGPEYCGGTMGGSCPVCNRQGFWLVGRVLAVMVRGNEADAVIS